MKHLTVRQLCDRLCISESTYYRMARDGELPKHIKVRGRVRFKEEDVIAWEEENAYR